VADKDAGGSKGSGRCRLAYQQQLIVLGERRIEGRRGWPQLLGIPSRGVHSPQNHSDLWYVPAATPPINNDTSAPLAGPRRSSRLSSSP